MDEGYVQRCKRLEALVRQRGVIGIAVKDLMWLLSTVSQPDATVGLPHDFLDDLVCRLPHANHERRSSRLVSRSNVAAVAAVTAVAAADDSNQGNNRTKEDVAASAASKKTSRKALGKSRSGPLPSKEIATPTRQQPERKVRSEKKAVAARSIQLGQQLIEEKIRAMIEVARRMLVVEQVRGCHIEAVLLAQHQVHPLSEDPVRVPALIAELAKIQRITNMERLFSLRELRSFCDENGLQNFGDTANKSKLCIGLADFWGRARLRRIAPSEADMVLAKTRGGLASFVGSVKLADQYGKRFCWCFLLFLVFF